MSARFRTFAVAVCLSALTSSACYRYTPVQTPAPGSEVRVVVPMQAVVEGSSAPPGSASFEGRVVTAGDTLVIEATSTQQIDAFRTFTAVDTLRMARSRLLSVEERSLSTQRTIAFVVGSTVGLFFMVRGFQAITGGEEGQGPPGGGNTASHVLRDILRLRIPLPGR